VVYNPVGTGRNLDRSNILSLLQGTAGAGASPVTLGTPVPAAPVSPINLVERLDLPGLQPIAAPKSPGGLFGAALQVLDFGRAGIVSTLKEGIDLVQGEGFSPGDWWDQATTHYGFGDLIHDERTAVGVGLMALAPFTAGVSAGLGAGVLADNIWADRIIGFVGDVAVDPLTYLGGFNVVQRGLGWRGAVKVLEDFAAQSADDLVRQGVAKTTGEAAEMLSAAGRGIKGARDAKSLSGAARALRGSDAGRAVAADLGLAPGARIRLPGTGPVGRFMRQDRYLNRMIPGLDVGARQARQIPKFYTRQLDELGVDPVEAVKAFRPTAKAGRAEAARVRGLLDGELQRAVGRAARAPVEFVAPAGLRGAARSGLGASLIARVTDAPIQGARKITPKGVQEQLSVMFNPTRFNTLIESDDPRHIALGVNMEDFMRFGHGKENFFARSVDTASENATRRGVSAKISDESMFDLLEDPALLVRNEAGEVAEVYSGPHQLNLDTEWFRNMPADVQNLARTDPEALFYLARDLDRWATTSTNQVNDAYGVVGPDGKKVWDRAAAVEASEGTPWRGARRMRETARARVDGAPDLEGRPVRLRDSEGNLINPDVYDPRLKVGGHKSGLPWEATGRFEPYSVRHRMYGVGSKVYITDPSGNLGGLADNTFRDGSVVKVLTEADGATHFKVKDPNVVGKSVRRQIDEAYMRSFGETFYENTFSSMADSWKRGMGRDIRIEYFMQRLRDVYPAEKLDDVVGDIQQALDDYVPLEGNLRKVQERLGSKYAQVRDRRSRAANTRAVVEGRTRRIEMQGGLSDKARDADDAVIRLNDFIVEYRAELAEMYRKLEEGGVAMSEVIDTIDRVGAFQGRYDELIGQAVIDANGAAARTAEVQAAIQRFRELRAAYEDLIRSELMDAQGPLIEALETAKGEYHVAKVAFDRDVKTFVAQSVELERLKAEVLERAPELITAVHDAGRAAGLAAEAKRVVSVSGMSSEAIEADLSVVAARAGLREAEREAASAAENVAVLQRRFDELEASAVEAAERLRASGAAKDLKSTKQVDSLMNQLDTIVSRSNAELRAVFNELATARDPNVFPGNVSKTRQAAHEEALKAWNKRVDQVQKELEANVVSMSGERAARDVSTETVPEVLRPRDVPEPEAVAGRTAFSVEDAQAAAREAKKSKQATKEAKRVAEAREGLTYDPEAIKAAEAEKRRLEKKVRDLLQEERVLLRREAGFPKQVDKAGQESRPLQLEVEEGRRRYLVEERRKAEASLRRSEKSFADAPTDRKAANIELKRRELRGLAADLEAVPESAASLRSRADQAQWEYTKAARKVTELRGTARKFSKADAVTWLGQRGEFRPELPLTKRETRRLQAMHVAAHKKIAALRARSEEASNVVGSLQEFIDADELRMKALTALQTRLRRQVSTGKQVELRTGELEQALLGAAAAGRTVRLVGETAPGLPSQARLLAVSPDGKEGLVRIRYGSTRLEVPPDEVRVETLVDEVMRPEGRFVAFQEREAVDPDALELSGRARDVVVRVSREVPAGPAGTGELKLKQRGRGVVARGAAQRRRILQRAVQILEEIDSGALSGAEADAAWDGVRRMLQENTAAINRAGMIGTEGMSSPTRSDLTDLVGEPQLERWRFRDINRDLQHETLGPEMERGAAGRSRLVDAGWKFFDGDVQLPVAARSRLLQAEKALVEEAQHAVRNLRIDRDELFERLGQLNAGRVYDDATGRWQQLSHLRGEGREARHARVGHLEHQVQQQRRSVETALRHIDDDVAEAELRVSAAEAKLDRARLALSTPAERADEFADLSANASARLDRLVAEGRVTRESIGRLEAELIPEPVAPPNIFADRDALADAFEYQVQGLEAQAQSVREVFPILTAAATRVAGRDKTVKAMREVLRLLGRGAPGTEAITPGGRFGAWARHLGEFRNADDILRHEAFVAGADGLTYETGVLVQGARRSPMSDLVQAERRLTEFNREVQKFADDLGVATRRVAPGDGPYERLEIAPFGIGDELEPLDELRAVQDAVAYGNELAEKQADAFAQRLTARNDLEKAQRLNREQEATAAKRLTEALQLEIQAREIEMTEWREAMDQATAGLRRVGDIQSRVEDVLASLELRRARVGAEGSAYIGDRDLADVLRARVDPGGYVPDASTGDSLFTLKAAQRDDAAAVLKDALSKSDWGPWRLASGSKGLDSEVASVINAFARVNDPVEWHGFWKGWDRFQTWLKAAMIATPGFVNRNIMGAFFNAWLDGVNLNEIFKSLRMTQKVASEMRRSKVTFVQAAERLAAKDAAMRPYVDLLKVGVRGGGQAVDAVELERGLRNARSMEILFGGRLAKGGAQTSVSFKPWSPRFAPYQSVRTVNSWVEDIVRLGVGMDTMRWGGTVDDALTRIAKTQFDYDELTSFERNWAKRFIPFYTWTRKNVPYQLKQLGMHPGKYNRLLSAKRNLELGTEEEGVVPDYYLEPFGVRLPFSFRGATVYTAPDIPFQDLGRYFGKDGLKGGAQNLLAGMTPILKTPLEVAFGKQIFTGVPFTGRYQQAPNPITKIAPVMHALSAIGWAKKNPLGEWKMRDHHIYLVNGMLPTVGLIRRLFPNEEKYQQHQIRNLFSTLGGVSVQFNTPQVQLKWLQNQRYEQLDDRQDFKDLVSRRK